MTEKKDKLIESLHPLERKVLPVLIKTSDFKKIVKESGLQEIEVMRALQWLQNKNVIEMDSTTEQAVELDDNGVEYAKQGLPERKFLEAIAEKEIKIGEIERKAGISKEELHVCIGILKGKAAIEMNKGFIGITSQGERLLKGESLEEQFLKKKFPMPIKELVDEERFAFDNLKKRRKIVKVEIIETKNIKLTKLGEELSKEKISDKYVEKLTSSMLKSGEWKGKKFRRYDIRINVPKVYGGRRHPLNLVINKMRKTWVEMGFKEMEGPWVESAFWCMDSMWIPQDHPAREMQDTFYLPYTGTIPKDIAKKVAAAHENGGKSGSKGYGYKWNPMIAKQLLLRTHTTAATYRTLAQKDIKLPAKYFCVGRIFRNETLDATHLPEFHQIEGFVMDEGLTLRDLMGYIREFYSKIGIHKIKFKPVYNPYTEPSMEAMGYNEQLEQWIELINSGIFRPESLEPYGIKLPVIAWGLGVERLAMMLYQQKNIREILGPTCSIDWMRRYKLPSTR